jgi:short-subunit dehydrogenase
MQLTHKNILLTGAAGGIGQAIAAKLSAAGARLSLVGRNPETLAATLASLTPQPADHQMVVADINNPEGRATIVEHCTRQSVDIVINCAGVMAFGLYEEQDQSSIEAMITTNLLAPMLLCQQLIPQLKQRSETAIVNVGSIFGSIGHPGFTGYCASKHGLRGFSEALQRELADTSVKVAYLAPRATDTEFNSAAVVALNKALGNSMDSPDLVAAELISLLENDQPRRFMGWPEKLFVKINGLFPNIVSGALIKSLPLVKQHSKSN